MTHDIHIIYLHVVWSESHCVSVPCCGLYWRLVTTVVCSSGDTAEGTEYQHTYSSSSNTLQVVIYTCIYTSIKIIKNEVGCRDDIVPKTGDTRRHCEVELTVCNNLLQPPKNEM